MEFINIPAWSAREVVEWLKGLDDSLHQYEPHFISQGITGVQLLQFSSHYFDTLTITKVGHQQLLKDAIQHLSHLHYDLCTENLQSIALTLGVKASNLGSYLKSLIARDNHRKDWLSSEPVLSRLAETVTAAKLIISWLDRPPFKTINDFQVVREEILQYALALTQETEERKISETSQEIKEICDKLVKKATDPLIIQTAYIEIVTLKRKKPDEELGLEIRTTALDGTHVIIAANAATPSGRKVNLGDEVLQVNYQTVVGWDHKKVIQALIANPTEVALTLKKRPKNLNQAGQLLRPSRHNITSGGLSSLPRRKHPSNTLHPPSTKDDLYLKTLVTQQESEKKKPPVLQKQPSHSDSEPPEPENKLSRLHRCPTMGESVLRRPTAKKSKEASGESRPRSLPLDTLNLDNVSTEDLRHWLEKQANQSQPHGKSAEQLSPRETTRTKKTVRILDLNGNSFRTGESDKNEQGDGRSSSTAEISLKIPPKAIMANRLGSPAAGKLDATLNMDQDVSKGQMGMAHSNKSSPHTADKYGSAQRKDLLRVADRGSYDSKCSSGSSQSSDGFIYWEEEEELPSGILVPDEGFKEMAVDVPEDFVPPQRVKSRYKVNPDYADSSVVVRRTKEKKGRRKARLSRRITCVDLGAGECEGWLQKRNENKFPKQWSYMLFKLKEFVLYYYKNKDAEKAKGLICLPGYQIQRHDRKDWGIKISHVGLNKTVYLAAEKESDWKKWMEHLQLASVLYTEQDKVKNRKSQILPEDTDVMKTVMQDFHGYHSESDDEGTVCDGGDVQTNASSTRAPVSVSGEPDSPPDEMTKEIISNTFGRRSIKRKSMRNVDKIYKMQTEYHPDGNVNEILAKKHMLSRTMEAKRKDVEELDRLLAQKITKDSFRAWQRDHPNLLHEITKAPSEKRDYSSDEEGSVSSDKSDPGATDRSPTGSRTSLELGAVGGSPSGSGKSEQTDTGAKSKASPKTSGHKPSSPIRRSTPIDGRALKINSPEARHSTPVDKTLTAGGLHSPSKTSTAGSRISVGPSGSQGLSQDHQGQSERATPGSTPVDDSHAQIIKDNQSGDKGLSPPKPQKPSVAPRNKSGHRTPIEGSPSHQPGAKTGSSDGGSPLKPQKPTELDAAAAATTVASPTKQKKIPPKVKEKPKTKPLQRNRTDSEASETSV